jgi:DNA-binding response OmpR family regulator
MSEIKILLVEDDPNLGGVLKEYLEIKGNEVTLAQDGKAGLEAFEKGSFDFCIFDVMLPVMDGFELGKKVREIDTETPFLYLTAKAMKEDRIEGLKSGADDYLTKPFSMEELGLRMDAILRRTQSNPKNSNQTEFEIGKIKFDTTRQMLNIEGTDQKLTTKESELLRLLCINMNDVLTREEALVKIWGDDNYFTARSMDVFITKLRKFLKADENIQIMNIHGSGYKLVV